MKPTVVLSLALVLATALTVILAFRWLAASEQLDAARTAGQIQGLLSDLDAAVLQAGCATQADFAVAAKALGYRFQPLDITRLAELPATMDPTAIGASARVFVGVEHDWAKREGVDLYFGRDGCYLGRR